MTEAARASEKRSGSRTSGSPSNTRRFLEYWFLPETVARALRVAGVVGPTLVAINHAEAVLAWEWTPRLLLKVGLTFLVPYAVSSWSSARALMQNSRS